MIDWAKDPPVVRFAPSPNGYLHLGHAYSALVNYRFAIRHGGRFLLRIEDIDTQRSRLQFINAILEDLAWLGVRWEEPVRRQSQHMADYRAALDVLRANELIYPCWCSRSDVRVAVASSAANARDPDGSLLYPGTCRDLAPSERQARMLAEPEFAWRLNNHAARAVFKDPVSWCEYREGNTGRKIVAQPERWGDVILARKDIGTSYHLAVCVDDAWQGISDVIRGEDLYAATDLHRLLQRLLNLPGPRYRHHRLLRDAHNTKLAKSAGTEPLRDLRHRGVSRQQILALINMDAE